MAISFIAAYENETPAASPSVSISCSSGDLLIWQIINDASAYTITLPSGFTQRAFLESSYDTARMCVATKIADGSETTITGSLSTDAIASVLVFRGVDPTTPLDVSVVSEVGTSSTSPFSHNQSITPTTNGAMIVGLAGWDVNATTNTVSGAFSGGSLLWSLAINTDQSSGYRHQSSGYASQSTAGSVSVTATGTAAGLGGAVMLVVMALRPESAAATIAQHSFRFFNDDGGESAATAKANINTNINLAANDVARIRMLIDANLDPAGKNFRLEFRHKPSGGSFGPWEKVN